MKVGKWHKGANWVKKATGKVMTEEERQIAVDLRAQGAKWVDIANEFGVTAGSAMTQCRCYLSGKEIRISKFMTGDYIERATKARADGASYKTLVEQYGMSQSSWQRYFALHGGDPLAKRMWELQRDGYSDEQIAKTLGCRHSCVSKMIAGHKRRDEYAAEIARREANRNKPRVVRKADYTPHNIPDSFFSGVETRER